MKFMLLSYYYIKVWGPNQRNEYDKSSIRSQDMTQILVSREMKSNDKHDPDAADASIFHKYSVCGVGMLPLRIYFLY